VLAPHRFQQLRAAPAELAQQTYQFLDRSKHKIILIECSPHQFIYRPAAPKL
jgi:hypothetical protein